jgi:hypothetical protein
MRALRMRLQIEHGLYLHPPCCAPTPMNLVKCWLRYKLERLQAF